MHLLLMHGRSFGKSIFGSTAHSLKTNGAFTDMLGTNFSNALMIFFAIYNLSI
jgi:hypothetical protein